jgi:hypothetical protein
MTLHRPVAVRQQVEKPAANSIAFSTVARLIGIMEGDQVWDMEEPLIVTLRRAVWDLAFSRTTSV